MKNVIPKDIPVIILDSSVLKKNHLLSIGFGVWLVKLAEKKQIELHIPYVVKNEILTQFEKSYASNTTFAFDQFSKLIRKNDLDNAFLKKLDDIEKTVSSILKAKFEKLFNFYNSSIFKIDPIEEADAINAFQNYFQGKGAFSQVKNREDLPDAFIYEVVRRLSSDGPIIVLSDDSGLGNATARDFKAEVYKTFEDLFERNATLSDLKNKLEKESAFRKEAEIIKLAFDIDLYISAIESGSILDEVSEKLFHESLSEFDEENYIISVTSVDLVTKEMPIEYLGDGEGRIDFELEVGIELQHFVHRGDMHDYEGLQSISIESVNDYVDEVTEPAVVKVSVESKFKVDSVLLAKAVKEEWTGKKLGRELGAKIKHDPEINDIEFVSFTARGKDHSEDGDDDEKYSSVCTTCGELVGTCDH
jgi:hypothetical protein